MMSLTLIALTTNRFSCCPPSGLLSVSVSEFHTVDAQPGEEVTLLCSTFTLFPLHITWFRLNSTSNTSRISSLSSADKKASFFGEFQNSSFDVTSNSTHLFLKMKQVDFSHSGLYLCGFSSEGNSVIVSATYFKVQGKMVFLCSFIGRDSYLNMILGALVVFLSAVIFTLVVLIRKPQTARKEDQDPQQSEVLHFLDVNYAALSFHPQAKSRRRPAAENELETHVLYSTTR
uniref:Ig-like domain-containing protein n=1 Tax=Labrus bergylta TaxID=56723 RepID=A0A3Q3KVZ2_9LABR